MLKVGRRTLMRSAMAGAVGEVLPRRPRVARERLYNGIVLPRPWPPAIPLSREVVTPPYLLAPPPVIEIDVGRQLFVDDFLIESTGLVRRFHAAEPHPDNPLMVADQPWESDPFGNRWAYPYSDAVLHDPTDGLYKAWYVIGAQDPGAGRTCLAVSEDGIAWRKERYDVVPGTNIVHPFDRDSSSICLDLEDVPARRYKMFRSHPGTRGANWTLDQWVISLHVSPDGIHWSQPVSQSKPVDLLTVSDRCTVFWNPLRRKWVFSLRSWDTTLMPPLGRFRRYWETSDLTHLDWTAAAPAIWTMTDARDVQTLPIPSPPQLYNLDCAAYESVLLGLFSIIYAGPNVMPGRPKINQLFCGFSRDGFHWDRSSRTPLVPVSEDPTAWNWGNVQSTGGCCLTAGDELRFYVSGKTDTPGMADPRAGRRGSMGLFTLRRDGFASMWGDSWLTTRPLAFDARKNQLFVNARGTVSVEVMDRHSRIIPGFERQNCQAATGDGTRQRIRWAGDETLWRVAGEPIRLRFWVNGDLFAFWVSPG